MDDNLDLPLDNISISGPTLASILQRFSSSPGDVDGLLFGHVTQPSPSTLLDDDDIATSSSSSSLVATVTGYFCSGTLSSFYDPLGRLDLATVHRVLDASGNRRRLIGWFVGRRRTPLRPSMREFSVSHSLSSKTLNLNPQSENPNFLDYPPCVFMILSTPVSDQLIHTHDYRAFQFRRSSGVFEPKPMDLINIGPAFRGHYGAFSPNSAFPWLPSVAVRVSESDMSIEEDTGKESLVKLKKSAKEQKALDFCAQGFEVGRLSNLMGKEAGHYTSELEDLYGKMLAKLEGLARLVEKSSAMVLEQEHRNIKLRNKFSGLE